MTHSTNHLPVGHRLLLLVTLLPLLVLPAMGSDRESGPETVAVASQLLERVLPHDRLGDFVIEVIGAPDGRDVFELESREDRLVVRGNSPLSVASGVHWFLKNKCNSQVSMNYRQVKLPRPLPVLAENLRVETPFSHRYFFNYCTYGYSMPWWDWDRWEQMIDYMAFMGVNMPLAIIGQ